MDLLSDRYYEGLGQRFSTQTTCSSGHCLTEVATKQSL